MTPEMETAILAFSRTFDTPHGEYVLKQIERVTDGTYLQAAIPRPPGPIDPLDVAARDEARRVYWYIVRMIQAGRDLLEKQRKVFDGSVGSTEAGGS